MSVSNWSLEGVKRVLIFVLMLALATANFTQLIKIVTSDDNQVWVDHDGRHHDCNSNGDYIDKKEEARNHSNREIDCCT